MKDLTVLSICTGYFVAKSLVYGEITLTKPIRCIFIMSCMSFELYGAVAPDEWYFSR